MSLQTATLLLTAALVLVTVYYAVQTQLMVREMREARRLSVRPKLTIDLDPIGPGFALVKVLNVGAGACVDADLTLEFVAKPGDRSSQTRRWRMNFIAPGEQHRFFPPLDDKEQPLDIEPFTTEYERVRLTGSVRDVLGEAVVVEEEIRNLEERWEFQKAAWHVRETDQLKELTKEVGKIQQAIGQVARRWRSRSDPREGM